MHIVSFFHFSLFIPANFIHKLNQQNLQDFFPTLVSLTFATSYLSVYPKTTALSF